MNEILATVADVPVRMSYAAGAAAAFTAGLFLLMWRVAFGRLSRGERSNALGFALMPAAAVWKTFEAVNGAAAGREAAEPLPLLPWFTENGHYLPARIELILFLAAFAGICLWLILRRDPPLPRGEVLLTAVCLWGGIRLVTEEMRAAPSDVLQYACAGLILVCLAVWTIRRIRSGGHAGRSIGDWAAAALCMTMVLLTASGVFTVGSEIGDLAVISGGTVLAVLLTLLCGSDERSAAEKEKSKENTPSDTVRIDRVQA